MSPKYVSKTRIGLSMGWFLVCLAMLFYLYDIFLQVSPSVMVPQLMHTYHIRGFQVGNLSAYYFYIYTLMMLPVGVLYDRFRLRWILLLAIAVCTIGAFVFGLAPYLWVAKLGRFLMGLGSAFAFIGVLKLATKHLPEKHLAFVSGITTTLGMIGAMAANLLLTQLVHGIGWRFSMVLAGCAGVLIFVLFLFFLRAPKKRLHYRRRRNPQQFKTLFLNLYLFAKLPSAWLNAIIAFLLFIPVTAFASLWSVSYLKQTQGYSPELAALVNTMLFFGVAVGGPVVGVISSAIARRKVFLLLSGLISGLLLTLIVYLPHFGPWLGGILFFLTGFFIGAQSLCFPIANEISPPAIAAVAFAFTNFIINLSGSVFQPVIGALLDVHWGGHYHGHYHAVVYQHDAFRIALTVVPAACFLAFILSIFSRETHGKSVYKAKR